jgi:hypothetical protein
MILAQVRDVVPSLDADVPSYVSVFARIADSRRRPCTDLGGKRRDRGNEPDGGCYLGKPARAPQHFPSRPNRLPSHQYHVRRIEKLNLVGYDLE